MPSCYSLRTLSPTRRVTSRMGCHQSINASSRLPNICHALLKLCKTKCWVIQVYCALLWTRNCAHAFYRLLASASPNNRHFQQLISTYISS